ncbi:MAG TPA: NADH:ubiquinone reductase (Na(+)-transporting) subunit A, partial [Caldithrix abyssi]|nr:NADH:ubiquinone reductase (Na(+)-transporting) subunit A [Caldithrix abyssi]
MAEFKFKKGYDIPIVGEPEEKMQQVPAPKKVAVLPQEFRGIKPKLLVREGDAVKRGTPLIADKQKMEIVLVAPVSGVVTEINRGERRMLLEVVIESDGKDEPEV